MKFKIRTMIFWIITILAYFLSVIITAVCDWFNIRFGVSFEEIIFTITSPLAGSDVSFLGEAVEFVIPKVIMCIPIIIIGVAIDFVLRRIDGEKKFSICLLYKIVCLIVSFVLLCSSISYGFESLQINEYISRRIQKTNIYEDYYVDPKGDVVSLNGQKKNVIYIYLESMETTYVSTEAGGAQEINYIPKLTQLAKENLSFSDTEKLGGAHVTTGASWTMAALLATTTGVPFSFPIEGNSMGQNNEFAVGITALGDILDEYGYNQVFLCGSDGAFAGRSAYYETHGNYEMKDYYYAIDEGYIPADYLVWWGYEDLKLYDIAKQELLKLAGKDEPFNFTMLTVDTHHVDGYICENCQSQYDHQLANVLECADRQINDFISWCQKQEFYEDTVIIITGDHFRMDSSLVADKERRIYNCIINSDKEVLGTTENRVFTTLDFFPTTLSAMGFEIKGDRLGLGTDLFSNTPTLAEELGLDTFNQELGKYSDYYVKEFQ